MMIFLAKVYIHVVAYLCCLKNPKDRKHMNTYMILEKLDVRIAVNILQEGAGDEIRALQSIGFNIVENSVDAENTESALNGSSKHVNSSSVESVNIESNYKTAKFISKLISAIGWLVFAVSIILILAAMGAANGRYGFSFWQMIAAMAPGFGAMVSGLFLVASGQVVRATVDNADHTYHIYKHLNSQ